MAIASMFTWTVHFPGGSVMEDPVYAPDAILVLSELSVPFTAAVTATLVAQDAFPLASELRTLFAPWLPSTKRNPPPAVEDSTCSLVAGVVEPVPIPTFPPKRVLPVPLGVRVTFWFVPPAANVSAPVPVIEPVVEPVPPLATGSVPVTPAVNDTLLMVLLLPLIVLLVNVSVPDEEASVSQVVTEEIVVLISSLLVVVLKMTNPSAGNDMASLCTVVILGGKNPLLVLMTSNCALEATVVTGEPVVPPMATLPVRNTEPDLLLPASLVPPERYQAVLAGGV